MIFFRILLMKENFLVYLVRIFINNITYRYFLQTYTLLHFSNRVICNMHLYMNSYNYYGQLIIQLLHVGRSATHRARMLLITL